MNSYPQDIHKEWGNSHVSLAREREMGIPDDPFQLIPPDLALVLFWALLCAGYIVC